MGQINATRKLVIEDFTAQRPWIEKLVAPINAFFEQVYFALVSGITIKDNLKCQVLEYSLPVGHVYSRPLQFAWKLNERPTAVILAYVRQDSAAPAGIGAHSIEWVFIDSVVEVTFTGLVNTKAYNVRLLGLV